MIDILKIILWTAYFISLYFAVFWFLVLLEGKRAWKTKRLEKIPFVSIAIPAYNEERKIRSTVESLLKLSYPKGKYEIIIVNDGSTDRTQETARNIIKENQSYSIKLISQKNRGKGAALNAALRKAKGEYFICLDADSYVSKDALKKILPHFSNDKVAAVLPLLKVSNPKTLLQKMQWLEYIVNMFYKELMSKLDCVHVAPGPFSVYRKSILEKVGRFDENNMTEDLEITLRLQKHNYRIVQLLNTNVYTIAPSSFKELYRQRNRWYKGSILHAITYRKMIFNKSYGDFGIIQMPTIIISGIIAVIIFVSLAYYALKPQLQYIHNLSFINFDLITLIRNFSFNLHYLDINYTTMLLVIIMLSVSLFIIKKSHAKTRVHKVTKYGIFPFLGYLALYFFILGIIWIGIIFDLVRGKRQRW